MTVNVHLTEQDWRAFRKHLRASVRVPSSPSRHILEVLGWAALGVLLLVLQRRFGVLNLDTLVPALAIAVIIIGCFVYFLARSLRPIWPDPDGPVLGSHVFELAGDGFRDMTTAYESRFAYAALRSIDTTSDHIFVLIDHASGYIVPRRSFASESACAEFLAELTRRTVAGRPNRSGCGTPTAGGHAR